MKLLMISGDRSILQRKQGAFWYTLQELRKHFERIDIICPRIIAKRNGGQNSHAGDSSLVGGSVFFHPCPKWLMHQPWWIVKRGKELIEEHGHNVMTVHEYPPFYNGIGSRRLARKTGIPYALEIHHIVGDPKAATWKELVGWYMSHCYLPRAAKKATAVRAVNPYVKERLAGWGVPYEKIHVVPSFYLDRELLTSVERPAVIYDVAFCGRLAPNKGLTELIQAVHELKNVRLLIIGDGPERERCWDLVNSLGLENRVTFLGWLPDLRAVMGAILSARIFVMNSRSEGGPRSALEAMAVGMPIIATPVGMMPEVIQDGVNGTFTTGEPHELAKKIGLLLSDEEQMKLMEKEAPKILDRFERHALVKEYADFLKSLAST